MLQENQVDHGAESTQMLTYAKAFKIDSPAMYEESGLELGKVKARIKELDAERMEMTRPLDESKKKIMEKYRPFLDALDKAKSLYENEIRRYSAEQERIRREEQRRVDEAARKEQQRLQALAQAKADKAAAQGKAEKAQEIMENVRHVPVAIVQTIVPKVAGMSMREVWKFRITDPKLIPREYLLVNETMLGKLATATRGAVPVPGVEFYTESQIANRA